MSIQNDSVRQRQTTMFRAATSPLIERKDDISGVGGAVGNLPCMDGDGFFPN